MSAAASPSTLPRTSSSRRGQPPQPAAYNPPTDRDRPHRTQSTSQRSNVAPASPRRSMSANQSGQSASASHSRTPSSNLNNVQRQDYEQSNLARPASSRRSGAYDGSAEGANPTRTDTRRDGREGNGHGRSQSRYNDQPVPAPTANGGGDNRYSNAHGTQTLRRRTALDTTTGHWELGKTIGAGSMGKVKLAKNKETGEMVAVKIVPRQSNDGEHRSKEERERADASKEVRTAREAAIVTLVDHPYICGMRDVQRTNYHWYMLFEYVNGGQMLDYIISHGRLKEKQARKFGRQIASALDYCHKNSIVHRDLKIENILISKTGDIKIIDFGLSNLFSPRSHLKTFCGSLYFAAPELLQAKAYTGPEVDVWSFGIVLYVLVCGKVPFDDQSMPQLHAKIKKGSVDYPPWLTGECKDLISQMLRTNPSERATLTSIMGHPWMTKGFNGPPDNFLPAREPLQLPLDQGIIEKMTGFDFGSAEYITRELTKIIDSDDYQRTVRNLERRRVQQQQQVPETDRKRGVFDFYKRRNSINSRDTLNTPSSEAVQLGQDPVLAYHPLVSIYYLAREKQEREAREKNPGALAMPQTPGEKPLKIPDMPEAPPAAYTNAHTAEMAGEKPTGGRSRPRARTHGEDEMTEGMQGLNVGNAPNPTIVEPEQQAPRREGGAVGFIRRLSTRRHKESSERPERSEKASHPPSALAAYSQSDTPRKSFSVRRNRDPTPTGTRPDTSQGTPSQGTPQQQPNERLMPPSSGGDGTTERSGLKKAHGLGRSISVNSSDIRRRLTRRGVSEGSSMRPPMTSASSHDRKISMDRQRREESAVQSETEATSTTRPPPAFANRTKSLGHSRRESMQARRAQRQAGRTSDVPEETDAEIAEEEPEGTGEGTHSPNGMKPVYLKGLFSVSTTSSRPLPVIRADIIRVLRQEKVEFREIKGGFSCKHTPSIVGKADGETAPQVASPPSAGAGQPHQQHQRKISFGRLRNADRDAFRAASSENTPPSRHATNPSKPSATYTVPTTTTTTTNNTNNNNSDGDPDADAPSSEEDDTPALTTLQPRSTRPRAPGETSTQVQNDVGTEGMVLRFEIFVVKVPLLSLHGVQFKKVEGGTWSYKNMAQRILGELRL